MKNSELNNALSSCHVMIEELLESNKTSKTYYIESEGIARSASNLFDHYHGSMFNKSTLTVDYAGRYYTLSRELDVNSSEIITVSETEIL